MIGAKEKRKKNRTTETQLGYTCMQVNIVQKRSIMKGDVMYLAVYQKNATKGCAHEAQNYAAEFLALASFTDRFQSIFLIYRNSIRDTRAKPIATPPHVPLRPRPIGNAAKKLMGRATT